MPKKTVDIEVAEEVIVADEPKELVEEVPVTKLQPVAIKAEFNPKNEVIVHWNELNPHEKYAVKTLMQYWSDKKRTIG